MLSDRRALSRLPLSVDGIWSVWRRVLAELVLVERLDGHGPHVAVGADGALAHQHVHRRLAPAAHIHLLAGCREYLLIPARMSYTSSQKNLRF